MDKRKSILNITVSISFRIVTMVLAILVKRMLIRACGNEVNGLNALYLSIVGFLSVAELGVGSAITFCMYKPIVEQDNEQVSALYHLFRRLYLIIGGIILVCGLAITPFIHLFAKDYTQLNVNLYTTFVLMLVSVVVTYLFGTKTALINAYKNNYITTAISSGGIVLQYVLQIIVVSVTQSFTWYLVCRIVSVLVQWGITGRITNRKYANILSNRQTLKEETKQELTKSIKAMFMHNVGTMLVGTADSMIISVFVGVVALGEYSNYTTILASITGILQLVFTSLTSVLGHLYVENDRNTTRRYCEAFHLLNFLIGTVFYLGYYAIIDNLISLLFAQELVVEKSISFVITLNGFVQFMRRSTLTFRDATGTFYHDRWKPLAEGIVNVILSVLLVNWIGVTGVIAATVITNLLICHVIEPYVLYKNAFSCSPKKYYLQNYGMILIFAAALVLLSQLMQSCSSQWIELVCNGVLSVGISAVICVAALLANRELAGQMMNAVKRKIK